MNKNIRTGKVMAYGVMGKGKTSSIGYIKRLHTKPMLFGEHLIYESDLPIAIVESEKTACIMSVCNPLIWLACGSVSNLQS